MRKYFKLRFIILLLWGCTLFLTSANAAGSGKALDFDGIDDQVQVADNASLDLTSQGTLEAWVYMFATSGGAGIIHKGDDAVNESYSLQFGTGVQSDQVQLVVNNGVTTNSITGNARLVERKWYHVAGSWNNPAGMTLYVNGVEDQTGSCSIDAQTPAVNSGLNIGALYNTGSFPLSGRLDEVRIWSDVRTAAEIQANMCLKQTGSEGNLVAYWRFDEASGTSCMDDSPNTNTGTMTNMDPASDRIDSGAAIGDAVTYDYSSPVSLNLAHGDGDDMTIDNITGSPDGVQVYRVDEAPNYTTAPLHHRDFSSAPRYWGVFITGGSDPTYRIVYNYNGYPLIANEDSLTLAYRKNNTDQHWKALNATLDTGSDTLTKTGLSGTEFILGKLVEPRNAIVFDGPGSSEFINITETSNFDLGTSGTIEAWVKVNNFNDNSQIIYRGISGTGECYLLRFGTGANNNLVEFVINDGTASSEISTTALTAGIWYHVAGVWDNDTADGDDRMALYVNGILEDNSGTQRTPRIVGDTLYIGAQLAGANTIDGTIDEVRIWNIDRSTADIQTTMCQKLTGGETGLVGYWRFDKASDTDTGCPDYTGNGNTGTMTNFPADISSNRVCSEAPIGDDSAYDYTAPAVPIPGDFSVNIAHVDGDDFTATGDGGTWSNTTSGLQVYRVDEAPVYPPDIGTVPYAQSPNGLTPPAGWSSIDYYRYWGVFVIGGTNPTYQAIYNYDGNPGVPQDETVLALSERDNYCDRIWADASATLNTTTNTLTKAGEINTEYVLGGKEAPLAIALASLTAEVVDGCINISWETATEIDTAGFFIWRSENKTGPYEQITGSFFGSTALFEIIGAKYEYRDCDVDLDHEIDYYYKMEEIVMGNLADNPFYGPVGPISKSIDAVSLKSSKSAGTENDSGCFISELRH